jgi:serine/threonine protein kinase
VDRARSIADPDLDSAITPVVRKVRRIGPYRLLELLGRGGMAEVYRAERPPQLAGGGPTRCVVKTIRGELAQAPEFARMFADEIQVMRLLQHPNIVQTYDHGIAGGSLYLAMELLDGMSLSRVVRGLSQQGQTLPVSLVAYIGAEIAAALAYAHAVRDQQGRGLGLVHRDVSPSNVMLLADGQVKLVDFGIARIASRARRLQTGRPAQTVVKGKPNYMAPEQLQGEALDGRADLFSLGVVLWELLVWRPLFSRPTTQEVAALVLGGDIEPPSSQRPEVPAALEAVILRALERDPRRRQASAAELERELRPFALPDGPRMLGQLVRALHRRSPSSGLPASLPPDTSTTPATIATPRTPAPAMPRRRSPPPVPQRARRLLLRGRAPLLVWTFVVAATAFISGAEWGRRRASGPVAAETVQMPVNPASGRGANIQSLNRPGSRRSRADTSRR